MTLNFLDLTRLRRAAVTGAAAAVPFALVLALPATAHASPSADAWDALAQCEASGNWQANTGNGFYGGLQFTADTWTEFGGTRYAPSAEQASREAQISVAQQVLATQGPAAWPVCSTQAGLTTAHASPIAPDGMAPADPTETTPAREGVRPQVASYVVRPGDTLASIADHFRISGGAAELAADNQAVLDHGNPTAGTRLSVGSIPIDTAPHHQGQLQADTDINDSRPADQPATTTPSPIDGHAQVQTEATTPLDQAQVTTPYRAAGSMWSSGYHTGVDFAAPTGTPVKAIAAGVVHSAGPAGAYGNEIIIRHADGHYSQYAHLSQIDVQTGQQVTVGAQIGLSGSTGNSSGPHLHFETRTSPGYGSDIDPISYLRNLGVTI
ncbi:transglycosylase family protein [Streptomyces sp. NPDC050848]|uniref:transglycosylase family protein n=1 Tax=Streptomyces sp. NPDC050848 TaxID=3155791 RepID=UPI0034075281